MEKRTIFFQSTVKPIWPGYPKIMAIKLVKERKNITLTTKHTNQMKHNENARMRRLIFCNEMVWGEGLKWGTGSMLMALG